MNSVAKNTNITAAFIDRKVVMRIEGRGSFKISPPLKQFIHRIVDLKMAQEIWIDMSDCTGMDSTFMGVMAGLSCYIKKNSSINILLINLSEKNKKLLVMLGVDKVVDYVMSSKNMNSLSLSEAKKVETLDSKSVDKLDAAKTSLDAHQALVNIHPENYTKFKSVLEYLQEDVNKLTP